MQAKAPNLWIALIRDYWSDPRNVIGPPGALVRRAFKCLWLVLSIYVLFWIAGPSQVASWQLWMQDDELAAHIAWGFTFAAALCFAIVGYVAEDTKPVKMPVFLPKFEGSWRNVRVHTTHLHLPNIRVTLGSLLAAALFLIALLGQWNYYLHDNLSTGGASVAAIEGSTSRVTEAETALSEHLAASAAALALIDNAIAETSAGSPTGRSRLVNQRNNLMTQSAATAAQLREELRTARASTVEVRTTSTDPRPVDGQVAGATGMERSLVSSLLDLLRSGVVEALLVMGAGLGLAGATSRVGVPKETEAPAAAEYEEEVVEEVDPAPQDEPPPQPVTPNPRFVLPVATAEDYANAVAVGPNPAPTPQEPAVEQSAETEAPVEPQPEPEAIDDPLVAEQLAREETEAA